MQVGSKKVREVICLIKIITKTRLYKYIVNFTAENMKILR